MIKSEASCIHLLSAKSRQSQGIQPDGLPGENHKPRRTGNGACPLSACLVRLSIGIGVDPLPNGTNVDCSGLTRCASRRGFRPGQGFHSTLDESSGPHARSSGGLWEIGASVPRPPADPCNLDKVPWLAFPEQAQHRATPSLPSIFNPQPALSRRRTARNA